MVWIQTIGQSDRQRGGRLPRYMTGCARTECTPSHSNQREKGDAPEPKSQVRVKSMSASTIFCRFGLIEDNKPCVGRATFRQHLLILLANVMVWFIFGKVFHKYV